MILDKTNKKILGVYTTDSILCVKDKPIRYLKDIPLGMSYIMSAVKNSGYEFELFVFSKKNNLQDDITKLFQNNNFDIVLFTSVSSQYFFVKQIAKYIKQIKPEVKNLIGGVHATLNYNDVLKEDCFDAVCVCDGEYAVVDYIKNIRENKQTVNIDNLYIKADKNNILKPNKTYYIQDLDKLQPPLRDIWNKWVSFPNSINSAHNVSLTRGCYNNCSYCSNHALAKISTTKYVRYRNINRIIEKINSIKTGKVYLNTESLTLDLNYLDKFLDALIENNRKRKEKIEYFADINIYKNILYDAFFKKLKDANIKTISVGFESGSYKIRKDILHRPNYTNEDFCLFCKLARKFNISVYVYALIGIPYEINKDYLETVNVLKEANPNFIRFYICTPYPGTDLYKKLLQDNLICDNKFLNFSQERIKALISYPNMSKLKIQLNYFSFLFRVYIGKKSLIEIIKLTMGVLIYSYNKFVPSIFYNFLEKSFEKSVIKFNKNNY